MLFRSMQGKSVAIKVVAGLVIAACILVMVVFVIILQDAERRIPVQYSAKTQGRRLVGGQSSFIPLKVNTANVIPVIFASSLMSFPVVISQFVPSLQVGIPGKIIKLLNSGSWFDATSPAYTLGALIYIVLIVLFAYFYTSITFNPLEIANNMKKQGGMIPFVRPGKPTTEYLTKILNYVIFIGAAGLVIRS